MCSLGLRSCDFDYTESGLGGARNVGARLLAGRIGDGRSGGFVISAMEDVVELGDGIATFDTDWHNAQSPREASHDCPSIHGHS